MLTLMLGLLMMQEYPYLYTKADITAAVEDQCRIANFNQWQLPETFIPDTTAKRPTKPILYFWRLVIGGRDSGKGDWHLYNKEDDRWLREASKNAQVEWTVIEGRLPL